MFQQAFLHVSKISRFISKVLLQLTERQTDRQTDRQTERYTERQTDSQTDERERPMVTEGFFFSNGHWHNKPFFLSDHLGKLSLT